MAEGEIVARALGAVMDAVARGALPGVLYGFRDPGEALGPEMVLWLFDDAAMDAWEDARGDVVLPEGRRLRPFLSLEVLADVVAHQRASGGAMDREALCAAALHYFAHDAFAAPGALPS